MKFLLLTLEYENAINLPSKGGVMEINFSGDRYFNANDLIVSIARFRYFLKSLKLNAAFGLKYRKNLTSGDLFMAILFSCFGYSICTSRAC